jgi:hypothetical protein
LRDWRRVSSSEAKREHYAKCLSIPAPSSSRPIWLDLDLDLSIASHIAMFQKMQRRPRDLQLGITTAPHSKRIRGATYIRRGRGGLPHVYHDAFACTGIDFMIQKGSCILSIMACRKDARCFLLYFQLDRGLGSVRCPTKPTSSGWLLRTFPSFNSFPGVSSRNFHSSTFTTSCS